MGKKRFDCVDMKRRGSETAGQATKGMTLEEELRHWQSGTAELLVMQEKARSTEHSPGDLALRAGSDRG